MTISITLKNKILVSKTITKPAQTELKEYHKELLQRERQERKDKFILLALAIAGLVGVYGLVLNGVEQNSLTESDRTEIEQNDDESPNRAAVSSLR